MTLNKQLINLLGILVAVIVLVAGLALIALPMYSQAQTINANATTVAQTNAVYQAQIDGLSAANERIEEIDQSLANLRTQIAAAPQLDDVYEIIGATAQQADVRIESIAAEESAPFIARTALDAEGNAVVAEPEPEPAPVEDGAAPAAETEVEEPVAPEPTTAEDAPQRQVLVTITIDVAQPYALPAAAEGEAADPAALETETDPAAVRADATAQAQKAAAFVDALGVGPRLLAPINVEYTGGKLTISVLAFIRTETAQ
ncbi:hypothetical protein [uncultured Microbacterium sp.]|uniref:hypothetical protein n=1 Tax=uncultured Microbacterium sp. TaxID=191216 RepID=UPI0026169DD5|nr:hypothetical protein [uncultured Microbacterium sp.]